MKSLHRLKSYLKPYLWMIVASGLLAIPLAAIRVGPVPLVKHVVDDIMVNKDYSKLKILPLEIIGLYILNFIVRFPHYYLMRIVIARVDQKLKNDLNEHLLGLSADYFTAQSTGNLISRIGSDPQYITGGLNAINVAIRSPITILFAFSYAVYLNWRLTIFTLVVIPLFALIFSKTAKHLKRYITRLTEINALLYSALQESFTGIRVVKMFRLEKYVRKKFREQSDAYTTTLLKTAVLEETSHPTVELVIGFAIAGLVFFGGQQVISGKMTPGDFFAFLTAFAMTIDPLRTMNDLNLKITAAATASERIFSIFDWQSTVKEAENPTKFKNFQQQIEFKNVSFAYPDSPQRLILNNVAFKITRGQVVALVGPSGAGKSSIVSLVPRIFDVIHGAIEIDGTDIKKFSLDDLRRQISVVSQDVFLFNDTIEENIRCGRLSATREEIREAAKKAHALDFIEAAPGGFQAIIGDRGQKLSGGERQRISIARAFLREAPILILDEATSSLDSKSERAVQVALDELMQDKTTLIIAHRLSTIKNANSILVLKDGAIIERGSHSELLDFGGEYAHLHGIGVK
jgi:subfamily B ATP-binding cassette protein MsbA